jgi:2-keto-4-pentenoate hydratase/2-oxohepta-3-ene-1,7-dioic acid hydratase in catechol pathway
VSLLGQTKRQVLLNLSTVQLRKLSKELKIETELVVVIEGELYQATKDMKVKEYKKYISGMLAA